MAKRLFHSCRSPSAAAAVTRPTTTLLPSDQHHVVPPPACCPRGVPRRRSHPSAAPWGNAVCSGADDHHHPPAARGTPAYRWLKSSRWHVIEANNAYATVTADVDVDDTPRLKIDARRRRGVRRSRCRRRRRALNRRAAALQSWSSSDDSGWFSTDDDEERRRAYDACIGAAELSTESSSTTTTGASGNSVGAGATTTVEVLQVPVPIAGGFAVVKRSEDPRADFRRSMADMVVGRGVYDADGLERLLRCFLALNDRRHRRDIFAAFGDVWEAVVFPTNPPRDTSHGAVTSHASSTRQGHSNRVCL